MLIRICFSGFWLDKIPLLLLVDKIWVLVKTVVLSLLFEAALLPLISYVTPFFSLDCCHCLLFFVGYI